MTMCRVLVVDGDADAAELLCELIGRLGHDCRFTGSSTDALREAAGFLPDVVIMDLGSPYTTGLDLARALRDLLAGRRLYLAALTAWDHLDVLSATRQAGFHFHALKPAGVDLLSSIMRCAAEAPADPRDHAGRPVDTGG